MQNKYEFKNYPAKIKDLNKYLLISKKETLTMIAVNMNIKCKDGKIRKYKRWIDMHSNRILPKKIIYGTSVFGLPNIKKSDMGRVIKFIGTE